MVQRRHRSARRSRAGRFTCFALLVLAGLFACLGRAGAAEGEFTLEEVFGEPGLMAPVPVEKPRIQFIGAAAQEGVRLRWTVDGGWLPPGGFRILRRKVGEAAFATLTPEPVVPRRDRQVPVAESSGQGIARRALLSIDELLRRCEAPAGEGGAPAGGLRQVARYRTVPVTVRSARDLTPEELARLLPAPPSPDSVTRGQEALEGVAERDPAAAAVQEADRARSLALTLGNTNWDSAIDLGLAYADPAVEAGQAYEYRIQPLGADGQPIPDWVVEPRESVRVTAGRSLAPPAPLALLAEPGDGRVGLHWRCPEGGDADGLPWDGVISYHNVYRGEAREGADVRVNDLPVVVTYTPAKEEAGGEHIAIEPRHLFVDRAGSLPGGGEAEPGGEVPAELIAAALGIGLEEVLRGIVNGREYWYSVEAVDVFGRISARSDRVAARPFVPPFPPRLTTAGQRDLPVALYTTAARSRSRAADADAGPIVARDNYADDVRLAWVPAEKQPPGVEVGGYRVYRQDVATRSTTARKVADLPADRTEFVDRAPARDRSYRYWICALDRWGNEGAPSRAVDVTLPDNTPLPRPRITGVSSPRAKSDGAELPPLPAGGAEILVLLKWDFPGAANLAGFNVYRAESRWPEGPFGPRVLCRIRGEVDARAVAVGLRPFARADGAAIQDAPVATLLPPDAREFRDWVPLARSLTVAYEVEAVTCFGLLGEPSERAVVRLLGVAGPTAPRIVSVEPEGDGVAVTWTPGHADERVAGYNLYWSAVGDGPTADAAWQKANAGLLPAEALTRTDREVEDGPVAAAGARSQAGAAVRTVAYRHRSVVVPPGRRYACCVEAVDADGVASERSPVAVAAGSPGPMAPPGQLAAEAGAEGVLVAWVVDDPDVDGCIVERALVREGPYRQVSGMVRPETPGQGAPCRHLDRSGYRGTEYYYRVVAFDRKGRRLETPAVGPVRAGLE